MYKVSINQMIGCKDSDTFMILLTVYNGVEENSRSYSMPIVIDKYLAEMFACAKLNEPFVANNAYRLMIEAIDAGNGAITGLYVNDRTTDNYACSINVLFDNGKKEINCDLFDLIIVSLIYNIPVYMTDKAVTNALKTVVEQREEFDKNGYDYDSFFKGEDELERKTVTRLSNEEIELVKCIEPYKAYLDSIKYKH